MIQVPMTQAPTAAELVTTRTVSTGIQTRTEPVMMSAPIFGAELELPCHINDGDLWFAERPALWN